MSIGAEHAEPLPIGMLGAARITALSLVEPAGATGHRLVAVAAAGKHLGGEPTMVSATAVERTRSPGVDERLAIEVAYPSGATGSGGSDMACPGRNFALTVTGTLGSVECPMFAVPSEDDTLVWRRTGHDDVVAHLGRRTSYTYQLEAVAAAVREAHRW